MRYAIPEIEDIDPPCRSKLVQRRIRTIHPPLAGSARPASIPGYREHDDDESSERASALDVGMTHTHRLIVQCPGIKTFAIGVLLFIGLILPACTGSAQATFICNGSDQTSTLQSALNNIRNGEKLGILGLCGIGSKGLQINNKEGITIEGVDSDSGFKSLAQAVQSDGSHFILLVKKCNNCKFRNLEFDMNAHDNGGAFFRELTNSEFERNHLHNKDWKKDVKIEGYAAVASVYGVNNTWQDNLIENLWGDAGPNSGMRGMWLGTDWKGSEEKFSIIRNNMVRNPGHTGLPMHVVGAKIIDNTVINPKGAGIKHVGPEHTKYPNDIIHKTILRGNIVEGGGKGFNGFNLTRIANVDMIGNYIAEFSGRGVIFLVSAENVLFENNVLCGNRINENGHIGFDVGDRSGVVIRNNIAKSSCTGLRKPAR